MASMTMAAIASRSKPLISSRSNGASSRRHARSCIRKYEEDWYPSHSLACVLGGRDRALVSPRSGAPNNGHRIFHRSPCHIVMVPPKALPPHGRNSTCARYMSSYHPNQEPSSGPPPTLADLKFRVSELERTSANDHQRLTTSDVQNQAWPLLSECASTEYATRNIGMSMQQARLERAKLSSRILELCLKGVDARRVFLWDWLQNLDEKNDTNKFSPTDFWNKAPHPTKEMFTLAISTYKNVIESCSSFSIKSIDAMELMESSAQQASSLLSLMEDEYSSDALFINAFNSQVPKGRYSPLTMDSTVLPDVRNYSEVIGTWGQCIDGSMLRTQLDKRTQGRNNSRNSNASNFRDNGAFQKRLQLEAAAMKSMMQLLESMEEDLYEAFISSDETEMNNSSLRKRPSPDRFCYNIILASMARQINPSLYEMRLVLQRMMERVKYELERPDPDIDGESDDHFNEHAMEFFPDVFSYNSLIEARANRSAMFATSDNKQQQQQPQQVFTTPRFQRHTAWQQQGQSENLPQRKRRFTSSEEEAILAEQTLEEMCHLATVPVRPNIWSYNAVMRAWIKSGSERGLQRAVMMLRSLALNGHIKRKDGKDQEKEKSHVSTTKIESKTTNDDEVRNDHHQEKEKSHVLSTESESKTNDDNEVRKDKKDYHQEKGKSEAKTNDDDEVPTLFGRIASWVASLLGNGNNAGSSDGNENAGNDVGQRIESTTPPAVASPRNKMQQGQSAKQSASAEGRNPSSSPIGNINQNQPQSRLNDLHSRTNRESNKSTAGSNSRKQTSSYTIPNHSYGYGRMALMNSVVQGNNRQETGHMPSGSPRTRNGDETPEPIGPMPSIAAEVTPSLTTFKLAVNALERRGNATSAKLAKDLLHLLEEHYLDLNPDITIYNSALNAWAKASKETSDVRASLASAQKADELICSLLTKDRAESGTFPQPNEYSFLMAINAWANAASTAVSSGNEPDGQNAAQHAEDLLKKLQKQRLKTSTATIACYGAVIRTWASLGHAERAQTVLEEMVETSERLPLDLIHFNAVLDAWVRNMASTKDLDEERIISRLSSIRDLSMNMDSRGGYQSFNVNPDTSSFNHVIRACYAPWASSQSAHDDDESTRHQALDIAYDCYTKMSQDYNSPHRPDAHTYTHMFKAIACLLPSKNTDPDTHSEKYGLCKTLLHDCCRDGHMTKSLVWILRKTLPVEDEFAELFLSEMDGNGSMNKEKLLSIPEDSLIAHLPEEWGRKGRKFKSLNRHRQ